MDTFDYTLTEVEKNLAAGEKLVFQAGLIEDFPIAALKKEKDSFIYNSADFSFYKKATLTTVDDLAGVVHADMYCTYEPSEAFFYLAREGETFQLGKPGNTKSCKINYEYLTTAGKGEKEIEITPTGQTLTCNKALFNLDIGSATMIRSSCYINGDELLKESGLKDVVFYEINETADCLVTYNSADKVIL